MEKPKHHHAIRSTTLLPAHELSACPSVCPSLNIASPGQAFRSVGRSVVSQSVSGLIECLFLCPALASIRSFIHSFIHSFLSFFLLFSFPSLVSFLPPPAKERTEQRVPTLLAEARLHFVQAISDTDHQIRDCGGRGVQQDALYVRTEPRPNPSTSKCSNSNSNRVTATGIGAEGEEPRRSFHLHTVHPICLSHSRRRSNGCRR